MTPGHPTPVPRPRGLTGGDVGRVAVGGAAGATLRWAVTAVVDTAGPMPWPTLIVNLLGCFLVGVLVGARRSTIMLVGIGFAGGLTTFSTFALECALLLDAADVGTAATYVVVSSAGGCAAVVAGRRVAA